MTDPESAASGATAPLTPEVLADMIRISVPDGIIAVQGFAENVSRPWTSGNGRPAVVYGEISLGYGVLSFQVPAEAAPEDDEPVVIEGKLRLRVATRNSNDGRRGNWRITLVGHVIGNWTPRKRQSPLQPLPPRGQTVPFDAFIAEHGVEGLAILATDTAKQDIERELAVARVEERPHFVQANFDNPQAFLQALSALDACDEIRGLALARGGGAGLDVIGSSREIVAALMDRRCPVYSALGHATDLVLLDRYADHLFHSPTALGSAIGRSVKDLYQRAALADELDRQEKKIESQRELLEKKEKEALDVSQALQAKIARWRYGTLGLALVSILLIWFIVR